MLPNDIDEAVVEALCSFPRDVAKHVLEEFAATVTEKVPWLAQPMGRKKGNGFGVGRGTGACAQKVVHVRLDWSIGWIVTARSFCDRRFQVTNRSAWLMGMLRRYRMKLAKGKQIGEPDDNDEDGASWKRKGRGAKPGRRDS